MSLKPVKVYKIDLDLPGSERWKQVFEENQEACKESFDEMDKVIHSMTSAIYGGWFAKKTVEMTIKLFVKLGKAWYLDELTYMAKAINVPVEKLIMCQLCYEICATCSSIGIPIDGKMYHYRTMDWDFEFLRKIT